MDSNIDFKTKIINAMFLLLILSLTFCRRGLGEGYESFRLPHFYSRDLPAREILTLLWKDAYSPDEVPEDVAEKGKTLIITHRGEPYIVYDVSGWEPGEDVVGFYLPKPFPRMDEERAPLLFFYPWHGEDSIDYKVDPEPLTVNGKIVGGILSPIESINILGDEEIDIEQIDLRTQGILTLTTQEFEPEYTIRRLRRFPDLEVVFMYLDRISYAYSDCFVWNEALHYKEKCWLSKWLYFRDLKQVTEIADLYLYIEGVRDAELWFLRNFNKLKGLWIESDSITDAGLKHLAKLSGLRTLDLYGTEVSEEGAAELREALPRCKITSR
jgi:hypothetical protein